MDLFLYNPIIKLTVIKVERKRGRERRDTIFGNSHFLISAKGDSPQLMALVRNLAI